MSCLYCNNVEKDGVETFNIIYGEKYDDNLIYKLNNDIKVKKDVLESICVNCFNNFFKNLKNKVYVKDNDYSLTKKDSDYCFYSYQTDEDIEILRIKTVKLKNTKSKPKPKTIQEKIDKINNQMLLLNDKLNKLHLLNNKLNNKKNKQQQLKTDDKPKKKTKKQEKLELPL